MSIRTPARTLAAVALILVLPLAACGKKAATGQAGASGEILPGSASDAMLPEDRVTSQPPLDPGAVRTGAATAQKAGPAATAAPEASAGAAEAGPAANAAD